MARKGKVCLPATRALLAEAGRGKKHSEETKAKMRAAQAARGPRSEETKAKISAGALGRPKSEATKLAISRAKKGRPGRRLSDEEKAAIGARFSRPWTPAQRAKLTGRASPHFGKPPHHKPRIEYSGILMRSTWEVKFAQYLDEHEILWKYEPTRFDLGDCTYTPDFLLTDDESYWEIKGWFDSRSREKARRFRELFPGTPLVVATRPVLRAAGIL